jgi:hypothetical protein
VTQYNVYRYKASGSTQVGTTVPPTTIFDASPFVINGHSQFYVTAVNVSGEGPHSAKVAVFLP